jgi:hypothetical protein
MHKLLQIVEHQYLQVRQKVFWLPQKPTPGSFELWCSKTCSPPVEGMVVLCNVWVLCFAIEILVLDGERCLFTTVFSAFFHASSQQDFYLERRVSPDLNATSPPTEGSK